MDGEELDLLESLLAQDDTPLGLDSQPPPPDLSVLDKPDSDSEEELDKKYAFERRYTDSGLHIKKQLRDKERAEQDKKFTFTDDRPKTSWKKTPSAPPKSSEDLKPKLKNEISTESEFVLKGGVRIAKPLLSEASLKERFAGRTVFSPTDCATGLDKGVRRVEGAEFVLVGAVHTLENKVSAAGNDYSLLSLTDFTSSIRVFLFGRARRSFRSENELRGNAVAVLNPTPMDGKDPCYSSEDPARILVVGKAKDWGVCASTTKAGAPCKAAVNVSRCRYCIHHTAGQYRKMSRASALATPSPLSALKRKILGMTGPVPLKKERLTPFRGPTASDVARRKGDLERLKALSDGPVENKPPTTPQSRAIVPSSGSEAPTLSANGPPDDLSGKQINARLRAAQILAESKKNKNAKKVPEKNELEKGSSKSAEFQKLMNARSAHSELLTVEENQKVARYFSDLETKEFLEEKMSSTYRVECRAVSCKVCGYRAFSSTERCRKEGHALTVTKAFKRFFKCGKCGSRTTCLTILPEIDCSRCGGSHWKRAPMLNEKNTSIGPKLSLRGDEETFIGGGNGGDVNLLVPEST